MLYFIIIYHKARHSLDSGRELGRYLGAYPLVCVHLIFFLTELDCGTDRIYLTDFFGLLLQA